MSSGLPILSYDASGRTRQRYRLGPLPTVVLTSLPLAFTVYLIGLRPFYYILYGEIFTTAFDPIHAGGAMDQPTIGKWLVLFTFFSVISLPILTALRFLSARRSHPGYWAYTLPAAATCVYLLALLSGPSHWLVTYVYNMGFTARREWGLVYVAVWYLVLLGFLCWCVRRPVVRPRRRLRLVCRDDDASAETPPSSRSRATRGAPAKQQPYQ